MQSRVPHRHAFSITELLVVIGIITLLLGILLVAMRGVSDSGKRLDSEARLSAFARACEAFKLEHGFYPGVVPEPTLAFHNHDIIHGNDRATLSSTENAMLHLLGGYAAAEEMTNDAWNALTPADGWVEYTFIRPGLQGPFLLKVNPRRIGEGPRIGGQRYAPYMDASELLATSDGSFGQWPESGPADPPDDFAGTVPGPLPDLVDGWGNPILYIRQARDVGERLVWDAHEYNQNVPRFYVDSLWPYTQASSQKWFDPCGAGDGAGSLLNVNYFTGDGSGFDPSAARRMLAMIVRSPISDADVTDPLVPGDSRAGFVVISAGADGIYFSAADGPGSSNRPIGSPGCEGYEPFDVNAFLEMGRDVLDDFDDIVIVGGAM